MVDYKLFKWLHKKKHNINIIYYSIYEQEAAQVENFKILRLFAVELLYNQLFDYL